MAKTGRKAKPTALKLIQGNPGNRAINEEEPQPLKIFAPPAPTEFDEFHSAKWVSMCERLSACRVLTELDLDALEMYVRNWVTMHESLADMNERGTLLTTRTGGVIWNPSWTKYKHAERVCRVLQAEFGMTPSSRSGLVASADGEGKNRWADF